ncbi:MAG: hypothetical protein KatS3mg040_1843 [Candidatus Kapaibacterium sp.]|nr:MAG: hypothetical protein KatS3mg040_1843 [Candidatus Kapabacteria bacterium]
MEGDALVDGRAEIERARRQAARRAPVEGLAEKFAELLRRAGVVQARLNALEQGVHC